MSSFFNQKNISDHQAKVSEVVRISVIPKISESISKNKEWGIYEPAITVTLISLINQFISEKFGDIKSPFYQLLKNPEKFQKELTDCYNTYLSKDDGLLKIFALSEKNTSPLMPLQPLDLVELETTLPAWIKFLEKADNKSHFIRLITLTFMRTFKKGQSKIANAIARDEISVTNHLNEMSDKLAVRKTWETIIKRFGQGYEKFLPSDSQQEEDKEKK